VQHLWLSSPLSIVFNILPVAGEAHCGYGHTVVRGSDTRWHRSSNKRRSSTRFNDADNAKRALGLLEKLLLNSCRHNRRVLAMRAEGVSLNAIARTLNDGSLAAANAAGGVPRLFYRLSRVRRQSRSRRRGEFTCRPNTARSI